MTAEERGLLGNEWESRRMGRAATEILTLRVKMTVSSEAINSVGRGGLLRTGAEAQV